MRRVLNTTINRLKSVKKLTPYATTIFFYDGWNLIEERAAYTNGTSSTIRYYWGKDLSGKLQGAGGVGGLLYLKRNGTIYIPHRDANGNIVRYTDTAGTVAAEYTYGAFGNTLSATGTFADMFHIRYSTKYLDTEMELYYYGYRFYSPILRRWLSRDPLEEKGGINLYAFCGNNSVCNHDKDGRAYFIKRSMFGLMYRTKKRNKENQEWAHEQLIFEDGGSPSDVGYFWGNEVREDPEWQNSISWIRVPGSYNDCVMRKVVNHVPTKNIK